MAADVFFAVALAGFGFLVLVLVCFWREEARAMRRRRLLGR